MSMVETYYKELSQLVATELVPNVPTIQRISSKLS